MAQSHGNVERGKATTSRCAGRTGQGGMEETETLWHGVPQSRRAGMEKQEGTGEWPGGAGERRKGRQKRHRPH